MPRLAILSTHPIQYYAPLFRALHDGPLDIHVFYGWEGMARSEATDHGFGVKVQWDIPLLDGYPHTFLENRSKVPGTHHFNGIDSSEVIEQIEKWRPDALLVFGWNYRSHLRALRHFHGRIPILFRGDSTLLDEVPGPKTWLRRIILKWIYRHIDNALYVGRHNRDYFLEHGLKEDQLAWAPHAVENERFMADDEVREREAQAWRRELGIADEERVILFVGKLEDKKDPQLLLEAFREARLDGVHLIFGGTGPLEHLLRSEANEMPNVHLIGFQNQSRMPVVYRLGDVFVLPSRGPGETWGLAVNEAMACRRPVIVSDRVGCAPDLVIENETGWAFPAGDQSALSRTLRQALAENRRLTMMGEKARELIGAWSIGEEARRIEKAAGAAAGV